MNLADKIKTLRIRAGKTQTEMAFDLKKTKAIITNWERGITPISADDLSVISNYFNISIDELVGFGELSLSEYETMLKTMKEFFLDKNRDKLQKESLFRDITEIFIQSTK